MAKINADEYFSCIGYIFSPQDFIRTLVLGSGIQAVLRLGSLST